MKLPIGKTYILEYIGYRQEITLLDMPRRNNNYFKWQKSDGRIFENRQSDVDSWIKLGEIKEKT